MSPAEEHDKAVSTYPPSLLRKVHSSLKNRKFSTWSPEIQWIKDRRDAVARALRKL